MAAPPVVEVNKQLWDDALTRLLDLSTVTVKRNAELETRVAELEVELAVWKQAHSVVVEAAEREKKAHNAQVATFNRQLSSTDHLKNQSPLILCVVDGDANVFSSTLIAKGQQGGREAAQELTKGIAEHLSQEGVQAFGRLSFWVTVYYNKRSLLSMLQSEGVCSAEQFEAFMSGLSQASLRFLLVDVGPGKDGAEAKILEYLQTYVYLPQTLRIFLAVGERTAAYLSTLTAIYKKELLGKVVVLQGRERLSGDFDHLPMHCLSIEGLFEPRLSAYVQKRPGPIPFTDVNRNVTTHGGLISPQSESQSTTPSSSTQTRYTNNGTQPIDPTKPLHKQTPPPCNEHYLMSCSKGANCKYSHDWFLSPEQLETLSRNAKKAPCNYLKNGTDCPYGDNCCWGHVCPSGTKCFHLSKGKCWFKGDGMHHATGTQEN